MPADPPRAAPLTMTEMRMNAIRLYATGWCRGLPSNDGDTVAYDCCREIDALRARHEEMQECAAGALQAAITAERAAAKERSP